MLVTLATPGVSLGFYHQSHIIGMFFFMAVMTELIFIDPSLGFPFVVSLAALVGVGIAAVYVLTGR